MLKVFSKYFFNSHLGVVGVGNIFRNIFEIFFLTHILWSPELKIFSKYFFNSQLGVAGVGAVTGADTAMLLVRSYVSQSHTELLKLKH